MDEEYQNIYLRDRLYNFFLDRRNQLIILGMVLAVVLFFTVGEFIKAAVFISVLFTANFLLAYALRLTKRLRIGFELILLSTVVCGVAYGSKVGMIAGGISAIVNYIGYKRVSSFCIVVIPLYMLVGWVSYYFSGFGIANIGIFFSIMYNAIMIPIIIVYMGAKLWKCLWFAFTNIVFNYFVFVKVAPILLGLMA